MKKLTKSQKQLIALGVILGAIVIVLAVFVFKPPTAEQQATYVPKAIDTRIPRDVLQKPEYRRLSLPITLPLSPGRMGRENPFAPYQ